MKNKWRRVLSACAAVAVLTTGTLTVSAAELEDIFDAQYYGEQNPDVVKACGDGADALYNHYLNYGIKEGRNPSALFNPTNYRSQYADLDKAFGDDWEAYVNHYLTIGLKEARDGGGEFDAVSYANRYPDLYEAYGYDVEKLYEHYKTFGKKEGRVSTSASGKAKKVQKVYDLGDGAQKNYDTIYVNICGTKAGENSCLASKGAFPEKLYTLIDNGDDTYTVYMPENHGGWLNGEWIEFSTSGTEVYYRYLWTQGYPVIAGSGERVGAYDEGCIHRHIIQKK